VDTFSQGICAEVLSVLVRAEMAAVQFARATGVHCPPGCGDCCRSHKPEDLVLSALPAAAWAIENGGADAVLERAASGPESACVFYDDGGPGHCAVYPVRPLICRLFGFAGRLNKHGVTQYRPCRAMGFAVRTASSEPPVFSHHTARVAAVYLPLAGRPVPLNVAFGRAAEWLLLRQGYELDPEPEGPPRPQRPPRLRAA
jgi:Fe-S-cluster containining protein